MKDFNEVYEYLIKESESWKKKLTKAELHAIRKYTRNSIEENESPYDEKFYFKLNDYLRTNDKTKKQLERYSKLISSGIKKFKLKEDLVCYRGANIDEFYNVPIGKCTKVLSFTSTTIDVSKTFKGKYSIIINVKAKTRCAFLNSVSRYKRQDELLIDKNAKYKILSRDRNRTFVEVVK